MYDHARVWVPKERCKHRWVNVKRWTEGKKWQAIMRCRWCDTWERRELNQVDGKLVVVGEALERTSKIDGEQAVELIARVGLDEARRDGDVVSGVGLAQVRLDGDRLENEQPKVLDPGT